MPQPFFSVPGLGGWRRGPREPLDPPRVGWAAPPPCLPPAGPLGPPLRQGRSLQGGGLKHGRPPDQRRFRQYCRVFKVGEGLVVQKKLTVLCNVVDRHRFDADPDPNLRVDWHHQSLNILKILFTAMLVYNDFPFSSLTKMSRFLVLWAAY
jgi:hypothetical protein